MIFSTRITRVSAIVALTLLSASSTTSAIDLSRAFGSKKNTGDNGKTVTSTDPTTINSDIAIQNAKKLVDDLNDAATGTITSYQPGREKEPTTCNDIMAKALVVANEEKTAIIAERDSIVKAASLLSERIDDLDLQLKTAHGKIEGLEKELEEAEREYAEKLKEIEAQADERIEEINKAAEDVKAEAQANIEAMQQEVERSNKASQANLIAERERSVFNMDNLKNATAVRIANIEATCKEKIDAKDALIAKKMKEVDEEFTKKDAMIAEKLAAAKEEIEIIQRKAKDASDRKDAEVAEKVAHAQDEIERIELAAMRESARKDAEVAEKFAQAESEIERIKLEAGKESDRKDAEVAEKLDAAQKVMERIQKEADEKVALAEKLAEEKVASILAQAEKEKAQTLESAKKDIENKDMEVQEEKKKMNQQMMDLKDRTDAELKEKDKKSEEALEKKQKEMDNAIAAAEEKIAAEKEKNKSVNELLRKEAEKASMKESELKSNIEDLKNVRSGLQKEVTFWMETHQSQGYCNVTLIKEDSRRMLMDAMHKARSGLGQGEEFAANAAQNAVVGITRQLQRAQSASAEGLMLVENEFLPKLERFVSETREKATELYDEHLADIVNQQIIPVYNQHVRPVYEEHVAPIVKLVKTEAGIFIGKSLKEVEKTRVKAVHVVEESSSSAISIIKEKKLEDKVPASVMTSLGNASKDGTNAVEVLWRVLLIFVVLLSRPLIKSIIGTFFSIVWFFCPLRLFVGRGKQSTKKTVEKATVPKMARKVETKEEPKSLSESKNEKKAGANGGAKKDESPEQ